MTTSDPSPTTAASLSAAFAEVVKRRATHEAVRDEDRALTYAGLQVASDALAAALRDVGVRPGELVGLAIDRTVRTPVGVLGILRAGAAYVPLDPSYPQARLDAIAEDCALRVLVDATGDRPRIGGPDVTIVNSGPLRSGSGVDRGRPEFADVSSDSPAYVIYTSGSTGQPKGCVVSHGSVLSLLRATLPLFDVGTDDRWTLFHSFSFDFSVWELWGALLTGATAVCVPAVQTRSPEDFLDQLGKDGITVLNQVPSAFRALARIHASLGSPPLPLRYVVFGGERIDLDVIADFRDRCGARAPTLVNMYGITETTVHVTFKLLGGEVAAGGDATPIGQPLSHLSISLRDENLQPVKAGAIGEICVSGAGLATGYLNRPQLTAERFPILTGPDGFHRFYRSGDLGRLTPDGELEYCGRNDQQVKVRGFRIEPGEVESALRSHPDVRDVTVVPMAAPGRGSDDVLVACVVTDRDLDQRELGAELRRHARRLLPDHLVPSSYELLPALPLTPTGKADTRALRALLTSRRRSTG
jgi:amino acid adenylation domain-containing protein